MSVNDLTGTKNIYIGSSQMQSAYVGDAEVQKMYLGETLVFQAEAPAPASLVGSWQMNDSISSHGLALQLYDLTGSITGGGYTVVTDSDYHYLSFEQQDYIFFYVNSDDSNSPYSIGHHTSDNYWEYKQKGHSSGYIIYTPTVTITGGTDVNNATLLAWFEANATRIS